VIWLVVALALTVIGLVTAGALGGRVRLDPLPEAVHTVPDTGLPEHPVPADLDRVRFDTALRGYDPFAVDTHLDAVRDATDPTLVEVPAFEVVLRGYRMDQVDAVLAAVAPAVATAPAPAPSHEPLLTETGVAATGSNLSGRLEPALAEVRATGREGEQEASVTAKAGPTHTYRPPAALKRVDLAVGAAYALVALWLLSRLFADPDGTYLSQGVQDQQAFEWYFGAAAHNLTTLSNPLFSTLQNFPVGVNLMANASVLGLSIPLAPITLLAGPHWTFVLIEWIGFWATALCWYALFVRRLHAHRAAAAVGGLLVGFSPAMVSHGNGHPNFLAQFLVPVIIDRLLDLQRPDRTRRQTIVAGVVLGLLVTWQLWMGEEVLLLASVGIAIVAAVAIAHRRLDLRTLLPGMLVGVATTLVLFAVPVWWQFAGPQSYAAMWQPVANNDLASLWGRATRTIGADPWASAALSMNRTEENAFFGIPLWFFAIGVTALLWRRPVVRAAAILVVLTTWLSLGTEVTLHGRPAPLPELWLLVEHLPLFDSLLPTRFTLIAVPGFAVLVVVALDTALRARTKPAYAARGLPPGTGLPLAVGLAVAVALAPLVPTRLWADPRPSVPAFFTSGDWREFVSDGSVLAVPPPDIVDLRAVDWQAAADWGFPLVEGYFMGPDGSGTGTGARGAIRRPFSLWLAEVARTGMPAQASPQQVAQFREDLSAWRVDAVVLPGRAEEPALRAAVTSVLGDPTQVRDVWVWDMREGGT
jgi:DivIVA domain-containing protein